MDLDLQEIVSFNLTQIGELAKKLSEELITNYSAIDWKNIKGMRDVLIHGYDKVDISRIWNTAVKNIPVLNDYCLQILESNKE